MQTCGGSRLLTISLLCHQVDSFLEELTVTNRTYLSLLDGSEIYEWVAWEFITVNEVDESDVNEEIGCKCA